MHTSTLTKILKTARLVPSIHNTQMWYLKYDGQQLYIYNDHSRQTPIADPELRDTWVSLGMILDVLNKLTEIHGGAFNFKLLRTNLIDEVSEPVVKIEINLSQQSFLYEHPYIELLNNRRSYRRPFAKPTGRQPDIQKYINSYLITNTNSISLLVKTYNKCAAKQSLTKGYMDELRNWIRLSKSEQGFNYDGLDHLSLNLSALDCFLAKILLNDKWVQRLKLVNLHGLLTDESSGFKNASGLLVKKMTDEISPQQLLAEGASYIQLWLEVVKQGFEACPISTLIDLSEGKKALNEILNQDPTTSYSVALRYGIGKHQDKRRVRLPYNQWLRQ